MAAAFVSDGARRLEQTLTQGSLDASKGLVVGFEHVQDVLIIDCLSTLRGWKGGLRGFKSFNIVLELPAGAYFLSADTDQTPPRAEDADFVTTATTEVAAELTVWPPKPALSGRQSHQTSFKTAGATTRTEILNGGRQLALLRESNRSGVFAESVRLVAIIDVTKALKASTSNVLPVGHVERAPGLTSWPFDVHSKLRQRAHILFEAAASWMVMQAERQKSPQACLVSLLGDAKRLLAEQLMVMLRPSQVQTPSDAAETQTEGERETVDRVISMLAASDSLKVDPIIQKAWAKVTPSGEVPEGWLSHAGASPPYSLVTTAQAIYALDFALRELTEAILRSFDIMTCTKPSEQQIALSAFIVQSSIKHSKWPWNYLPRILRISSIPCLPSLPWFPNDREIVEYVGPTQELQVVERGRSHEWHRTLSSSSTIPVAFTMRSYAAPAVSSMPAENSGLQLARPPHQRRAKPKVPSTLKGKMPSHATGSQARTHTEDEEERDASPDEAARESEPIDWLRVLEEARARPRIAALPSLAAPGNLVGYLSGSGELQMANFVQSGR